MPPRRRTEKRRVDQLSYEQRMDLELHSGRLGRRGDDGRVGRLWEDEAHRRAAWEAHRDSLLRRFRAGDGRPPAAADEYETDPEYQQAAIKYWAAEVNRETDRAAVRDAADAASARRAYWLSRRIRVFDDQASAAMHRRR